MDSSTQYLLLPFTELWLCNLHKCFVCPREQSTWTKYVIENCTVLFTQKQKNRNLLNLQKFQSVLACLLISQTLTCKRWWEKESLILNISTNFFMVASSQKNIKKEKISELLLNKSESFFFFYQIVGDSINGFLYAYQQRIWVPSYMLSMVTTSLKRFTYFQYRMVRKQI